MNRYGLEYLGMGMEELCGWSWVQVLHAADREPAMHAWIEATPLKQPFEIRYRMLSALGIAAIVTDMTEEKRLQAALQKLKPEVGGRSVSSRSRSSAA